MLSRVAENLYWLGRNLERAENLARLADVTFHAAVEQQLPGASDEVLWDAVVATTGARASFVASRKKRPNLEAGAFVLLDRANEDSLASTVARARELARELRPQISREVWEEVNALHLEVTATASLEPLGEFCARVKRSVAATIGMFDNTVLLDEGREWFRCGIFLERANMMSRIMDAKYFVLLPGERRGRRTNRSLPMDRGAALGGRTAGIPAETPGSDDGRAHRTVPAPGT